MLNKLLKNTVGFRVRDFLKKSDFWLSKRKDTSLDNIGIVFLNYDLKIAREMGVKDFPVYELFRLGIQPLDQEGMLITFKNVLTIKVRKFQLKRGQKLPKYIKVFDHKTTIGRI